MADVMELIWKLTDGEMEIRESIGSPEQIFVSFSVPQKYFNDVLELLDKHQNGLTTYQVGVL